jgi:hypothetical protein
MYIAHWKFKSTHIFCRAFNEYEKALELIYDTGIATHQHIVAVWIEYPDKSTLVIKHEQKEQTQNHN